MTYKVGYFYVTPFSMKMPLFRYRTNQRHPAITVGLAITSTKEQDDYTYVAQSIKTHGKIDSLVYGTDGELAMENAFENTFPICGIVKE